MLRRQRAGYETAQHMRWRSLRAFSHDENRDSIEELLDLAHRHGSKRRASGLVDWQQRISRAR
ncbi:MAG: hypothetical protein DWQ34_20755 [Planctomycetota bacterium]|nr:MAG: hypothetical protein DWQ29_12740 [Planctomycetota bacterium]REJ89031.1 MAG: hypothetical protein DWQ34_20755 [Planctomycetota bacterium]REK29014.1 MAG: hypothetical protein DWQ41_05580 [Planctomycetota bacterium]REK39555.1 MAG: hypothetical protein DWQ45_01365 [Planctomycetota bacterium]